MIDEKRRIKDKIFKILPMKEKLDNGEIDIENFKSYITNCYVFLNGKNIDAEILDNLRGLKEVCQELTHQEIKSVVFGMVNSIDRSE